MATVQSTRFIGLPDLLSLVTRVRQEVTKETLTSLTNDPVNNVIVHALNDAVEDIYMRYKWAWSKTTAALTMVAGTSDYTLPAGFYRLATEPEIGARKLREIDIEEWAYYTGNPSLSGAIANGAPAMYTVDRGFIRFYPTPSTDFVSTVPTVTVTFYERPSTRLLITDGSSALNIPPQFQEALVRFAVARLKIFYHYDDYRIDQDRFEFLVQQQLQNDTNTVHPSRFRPRNRYSSNYG